MIDFIVEWYTQTLSGHLVDLACIVYLTKNAYKLIYNIMKG